MHTIISNWTNFTFAVIINASALRCFYLFVKNKLPAERKTILILSLSMLCLFYVANFHEYLKSGVWYRGFWSQPLSIMITFLLIDIATQSIPKIVRKIVLYVYSWPGHLLLVLQSSSSTQSKNPKPIPVPATGGIYIANSPSWITTVEQTTEFLNHTLKPNELFFALPYDCLYYYLTDKKTPTRQLIFFEHIKIPTPRKSP